jgi:hypothetical protein
MGRTLVFGIGLKEKDNLNKKQELQNAIGYGMFTRGYGEYLSGAAVLGGEVGYTGKVRSKAQSNPKKGRKVSAFDHTEGGARYLEKGVCSECGEPTTIEYYDVVNPDGTKTPKKVTRCSSRKHDMQDKGCEPKVEEV